MRRTTTRLAAVAATALLSTALLVGCGEQGAPAADTTGEQDGAAVEQAEPEPSEPAPEPEMSNWTESAFYDRPLPQIKGDLELLGFELTGELYDDSDPSGTYTYFMPTFQGTPESNPVEGSGETVTIGLTYENPTFEEGAEERTCETIDQEVLPNGATIMFYLPEADPSEYGTIARGVADAVGLPEFTDSYVGDFVGTGRIVGNFTYPDTFKDVDTESMLVISTAADPSSLPDPDMPLMVSYGPYVSEPA